MKSAMRERFTHVVAQNLHITLQQERGVSTQDMNWYGYVEAMKGTTPGDFMFAERVNSVVDHLVDIANEST